MKLLFFSSDFQIGLSALLVDEAIAFHQQGIPILCLAGEKEQEEGLKRFMEDNGVPLLIVDGLDEHRNFFVLARRIKQIIEEYAITHIHVQNNWQLAIIAYIRFILRIPSKVKVIYTLHGFRHNNLLKSVIARIMIGTLLWLTADRIICMCKYLQSVFWPLKYKSVLLPLGISEEFFETHELPSIQDNGLQIIYPAQFRHGKNQELVIKAFADYLEQTRDEKTHLWLPGSGELLNKAKALASSLSLQNRISFPGQCTKKEVVDQYRKCNVAVVASNRETFGQSIVEPWVMGLIVVSRPVGIAPDIISPGQTGFLFKTQAELTSIWKQIANIPETQKKITGNTNREGSQFSWQKVVNLYKQRLLND